MPARAFRIAESVLRVIPSRAAESVTLNASGSSQPSRNTSPGCGGLCITVGGLVIVAVVDMDHILSLHAKVTRQLPLTFSAHVPRSAPFNS